MYSFPALILTPQLSSCNKTFDLPWDVISTCLLVPVSGGSRQFILGPFSHWDLSLPEARPGSQYFYQVLAPVGGLAHY